MSYASGECASIGWDNGFAPTTNIRQQIHDMNPYVYDNYLQTKILFGQWWGTQDHLIWWEQSQAK